MTSKPRNRIVVFRLSQDEYHSLQDACNRSGARSLSDFTRTEILRLMHLDAQAEPLAGRFAELEQQIAAMQIHLNRVLQGVFHDEVKP